MAAKSVTIEIGNEFIKICEMQSSKKNIMVHHAISVQTPQDAVEDGFVKDVTLVSETIRNAMREESIATQEVTFVLNSSRVATKEVILPLMKKDRLQETINANASDYFPVNIDDYVLAFTVLENKKTKEESKSRVLVFAAPEPMIESYYSLGRVLGVKVKAVDYAVNSTMQLTKMQIDAKPTLVVQVGMDNTIASVMCDNVLQLQRTIPYGESLLLNEVMEAKKMSAKAAMDLLASAKMVGDTLDADEITGSLKYLISNVNRVIEYYAGRNQDSPLQKVVIIGEGADVLGMDKLFSNETNLPAESLTVLKNVESYNRIKLSTSLLKQYMANIGGSLDPINFAPKSQQFAKAKTASKGSNLPGIVIGGVLIACAVVLAAYPTIKYNSLESKQEDLQKDIAKIKDIESVISDYNKAKSQMEDAQNCYLSTVNDSEYTYDFIQYLESSMPTDMRVATMSVSKGVASMNLVCTSRPQIAFFIEAMEKNPNIVLTDVSTIKEESSESSQKTYTFSCKVTYLADEHVVVEEESTEEGSENKKAEDKEDK